MEVSDAVGAVVGGGQPGGPFTPGPGDAGRGGSTAARTGRRRSTVRELLVTCSIRSSLASRSGSADSFQVRVRWKLIPGRGAAAAAPGPPHRRAGGRQIRGQLAQAPAGERQAQLLRPGGGRRDDHLHVIVRDPAGTASRQRAQRGQALLLNKCTTSRTVSSSAATSRAIAGTERAGRRRHNDHRPAHPDRPMLSPPHDLLQPLPLLISQPPRPHRLSHPTSQHPASITRSSVGADHAACQQTR